MRIKTRRGGILGALEEACRATGDLEATETVRYVKLSRQAMACQFEVFLRPEDTDFTAAVHDALNEVDRLEQQMTVYSEDSELRGINRSAWRSAVVVDPKLYGLLRWAREVGRETNGAFDVTSGALIRCWGFLDRKGKVPEPQALAAAREVTGWNNVDFDDATRSIRYWKRGVEINLGSVGKGYALDRAALRLRRLGLRNFVMHAGHSSVAAYGDSAGAEGWRVRIRDPQHPGEALGTVLLKNEALSTSGSAEQFFEEAGVRYGHILDPRTGWPAGRRGRCSVVAPTAALAEALSTAFFVMPEPEVRSYYRANPGLRIILCDRGEPGSRAATVTIGMPGRGESQT